MTSQSYGQILNKVTNKGTCFLPVIFNEPSDMNFISRKNVQLELLFQSVDINNMGRIDAYEILSVISIFVEGTFEQFVEQIFENFSFNGWKTIRKDEMIYFIDGIFRGLSKVCVPIKDLGREKPGVSWRLIPKDVEEFVNMLFMGKPFLDREEFFVNFTQINLPIVEFLKKIKNQNTEDKPDEFAIKFSRY